MKIKSHSAPSLFVSFIASLFVLLTINNVAAEEMCPAVNCDCSSLPNDSWQLVCSAHENNLKEQCYKNGNKPTDFCSLHGPAATPLPMVLRDRTIKILAKDEIDKLHERAETMYWSIHTDVRNFKALAKNARYGEAKGTLNIVDRNLETLFENQLKVTISYEVHEKLKEAKKAWGDYSEKSLKEAKVMHELGQQFWEQRQKTGDPKQEKAYRIYSMKLMRMSSKAYEMAAHAFAGANKDAKAAEIWHQASNVSKDILEMKEQMQANSSHIDFYRKQVAARLHRASYHLALGKSVVDANSTLRASQDYMEDSALLKDILNEDESVLEPLDGEAVAGSSL